MSDLPKRQGNESQGMAATFSGFDFFQILIAEE